MIAPASVAMGRKGHGKGTICSDLLIVAEKLIFWGNHPDPLECTFGDKRCRLREHW